MTLLQVLAQALVGTAVAHTGPELLAQLAPEVGGTHTTARRETRKGAQLPRKKDPPAAPALGTTELEPLRPLHAARTPNGRSGIRNFLL